MCPSPIISSVHININLFGNVLKAMMTFYVTLLVLNDIHGKLIDAQMFKK